MRGLHIFCVCALIGWCLTLTSCPGTRPPPRQQEPPAAADVADLAAREKAAGMAAAEAKAKGDDREAEYQSRLAAAIKPLREAAEARQRGQQAEMDVIAKRQGETARADAEAEQLAKDRRWAGIAVGACVAAAVAMLVMGLPSLISVGLPGAAAAGLLWVAAWSSVPWLAWALGLGVACCLLLGLAGLAVYIAREWSRWAADRERLPRAEADAASLARQPKPVRWLVSRLLGVA
jgi:hypothetical protein